MHPSLKVGSSAELLVAYRFIQAGRRVCWPLVTCGYDLVVDSGDHLFRIQVKQGQQDHTNGGWRVTLQKTNPSEGLHYAGRYDYLCVVTTPNETYVIPEPALRCAHAPERVVASVYVGKSERFAAFVNRFGIGTGEFREVAVSELTELASPKRSVWFANDASSKRKRHRKLTREQVLTLQSIPIRSRWDGENPDAVPIEQIAQQFGVHVATVRNLLKGKRKDLGPRVNLSA